MHASPQPLFVRTHHVAAIVPVLYNAFLADAVTSLRIQRSWIERSDWLAEPTMDDAAFCAVIARFPNLLSLHMHIFGFQSIQEHLLSQLAFSKLTTFALGGYRMSVPTFFTLLSMMPALKILELGNVSSETGFGGAPDPKDVDESVLARPACSLTHLVAYDTIGLTPATGFAHYSLLLSRSHDTLEVVELRWLPYPETGDDVRAALLLCTRVRHLVVLRNEFPAAPLIAVCPRLQSMSLTAVPTAEEVAALHAPLFRLEIYCTCEPELFFTESLHQLRAIVHDIPMLQIIWLNLQGWPLFSEAGAYRELRALCKERRVHLSVVYDGVPWFD